MVDHFKNLDPSTALLHRRLPLLADNFSSANSNLGSNSLLLNGYGLRAQQLDHRQLLMHSSELLREEMLP